MDGFLKIVPSLSHISKFALPFAIIGCLMVVLIPLPAWVLDQLLTANIAISVIVLLTAVYVKTPLEFSVFPTVLLATVLARLVLNIATTRLILTEAANSGMDAAGGVIRSFGQFVAGDQLLVGIIIFSIIAVIQFVVITKGATRISEVAARFALDGMPGRQMAVDADLNARLIDENEAQRRRLEIVNQADFYGAMDGASKFVRGDAIASVFITLINVSGGLVLGVFHFGMSPANALSVFTKLTIGDGLVSQVPALLISLAAGMLVTRSTQRVNLPVTFFNQLFSRPEVLAIAGLFLFILVGTSLPKIPLLMLGMGCAGFAVVISRQQIKRDPISQPHTKRKASSGQDAKKKPPRIEDFLRQDAIEVELGINLIRLADRSRNGILLQEIQKLRQAFALNMGIVLPNVRIRDNLQIDENAYRIKLNGVIVSVFSIPQERLIVTFDGSAVPGVCEPYDHPSVPPNTFQTHIEHKELIEESGGRIWSSAQILVSHLRSTVTNHAAELLSRDATRALIDELKKTSPTIVSDLIPQVVQLHEIQEVLKRLLAEGIPIRQLGQILELIGNLYRPGKPLYQVAEGIRKALSRTICQRFRDSANRLHVITLDPALESRIQESISISDEDTVIQLDLDSQYAIAQQINQELVNLLKLNRPKILVVSPTVRPLIRPLVNERIPDLITLSYQEITTDTKVVSHGIVSL